MRRVPGRHECISSDIHSGGRCGYRSRRLDTRRGTMYLMVPKLHGRGYIPKTQRGGADCSHSKELSRRFLAAVQGAFSAEYSGSCTAERERHFCGTAERNLAGPLLLSWPASGQGGSRNGMERGSQRQLRFWRRGWRILRHSMRFHNSTPARSPPPICWSG